MAALSRQIRLFDGLERTRDGAGALPAIFEERGPGGRHGDQPPAAILGTLALYRASAGASNDANG